MKEREVREKLFSIPVMTRFTPHVLLSANHGGLDMVAAILVTSTRPHDTVKRFVFVPRACKELELVVSKLLYPSHRIIQPGVVIVEAFRGNGSQKGPRDHGPANKYTAAINAAILLFHSRSEGYSNVACNLETRIADA